MGKTQSIWILSGETSGDIYGSKLAQELRLLAESHGESLVIAGMGGQQMRNAGIDIRVDSTELGVIGVIEVFKHLFTFIRAFYRLISQARKERPGAVVLIDYPGFNLLFALVMRCYKIPVIWYVCPQLWVWGKWRLPVLARICTKMLVIFPFETEVFAKTKLHAEFVGHPLVDIIAERHIPGIKRNPEDFLLLPGSRSMEINFLLQPMLQTVAELHKHHPELKFHLTTPREKISRLCQEKIDDLRRKIPDIPEIEISCGDIGYWQQRAGTGLAASGTVTVEAAIEGLPLVVGYKLNWITILLASLLVKLYRGFFTMANIIANHEVYEEFLQFHFRTSELVPAVERILPNGVRRQEVEAGMTEIRKLLAPGSTSAARQAAEACYSVLADSSH